ncbi:hypothetical protein HMPREF1486_03140 [Streptomyces sp. HPH0547]|nr:hypothetical protein HMPREF1486_03140 [Streptomyces sp. HPH0547]
MESDVHWVDCGPGCPNPQCLARQEQREETELAQRLTSAAHTTTDGDA